MAEHNPEDYQKAQRRIANAVNTGRISQLSFFGLHIDRIPSDISSLIQLEDLNLGSTEILDVTPIFNLRNLIFLQIDNTQVTDLTPLGNLQNLELLNVRQSDVADLRPLRQLFHNLNTPWAFNIMFNDTPATRIDPELRRLSEIKDDQARTEKTLAYLNSLDDAAYDDFLRKNGYEPAPRGDRKDGVDWETIAQTPIFGDAMADIENDSADDAAPHFILKTLAAAPVRTLDDQYFSNKDAAIGIAKQCVDTPLSDRSNLGWEDYVFALRGCLGTLRAEELNPRLLVTYLDMIDALLADDMKPPLAPAFEGLIRDFMRYARVVLSYYEAVVSPPEDALNGDQIDHLVSDEGIPKVLRAIRSIPEDLFHPDIPAFAEQMEALVAEHKDYIARYRHPSTRGKRDVSRVWGFVLRVGRAVSYYTKKTAHQAHEQPLTVLLAAIAAVITLLAAG